MRTAALAAAADGQWLFSGLLWLALTATFAEVEGECRWEAWCALRRVEPPSERSVELEAHTIRGLVLKKGMRINSPEVRGSSKPEPGLCYSTY